MSKLRVSQFLSLHHFSIFTSISEPLLGLQIDQGLRSGAKAVGGLNPEKAYLHREKRAGPAGIETNESVFNQAPGVTASTETTDESTKSTSINVQSSLLTMASILFVVFKAFCV